MTKKWCKVVDQVTGRVLIAEGEDESWFKKMGYDQFLDVELADDGRWYLLGCSPSPSPEQVQVRLIEKVQTYLDDTAQKLGYDSCLSVCSYVDTGVVKFDEEGEAFRKWRSAVWAKGYEIVAEVQAGTREIPTEEELFAELPIIELDREELKA